MMAVPVFSGLTGDYLPIYGTPMWSWWLISVLYFLLLSNGSLLHFMRMRQSWDGLMPLHWKAFWTALHSRVEKPRYEVTRKTRLGGFYGRLLWPQFSYIAISIVIILHLLTILPEQMSWTYVTTIAILLYYVVLLGGVCRASFYGVELPLRKPDTAHSGMAETHRSS
jgi:hypothetical protein